MLWTTTVRPAGGCRNLDQRVRGDGPAGDGAPEVDHRVSERQVQLTTAQTAIATVLAAVLGIVGYELSERDRHRYGRSPWGWPSIAWGVLWFLFFALGLVLFVIARRTELVRRQRADTSHVPPAGGGGPYGGGPYGGAGAYTSGAPVPASPQSEAQDVEEPPDRPVPSGTPTPPAVPTGTPTPSGTPTPAPTTTPPTPPAPTAPPAGPLAPAFPPPGWYPDPGGNFEYRWWEGSMWTPYVSTGGHPQVDTSEDQRIGPYPGRPGGGDPATGRD